MLVGDLLDPLRRDLEVLTAAGRRVIAPDARGHGRSEKPHDPSRYGEDRMARDLAVLLDVIDAPEHSKQPPHKIFTT